jgi:hypothetical protein
MCHAVFDQNYITRIFIMIFFQLLDKRIENFINSYKNNPVSNFDNNLVDGEISKLHQRWNEFKLKNDQMKKSLTAAQQYFSLLEIVSEELSKLK